MANLNDTPQWPDVYQLEQSDPVVGGAPNPATGAGMDNIPHLQLAQRTAWLRAAVTALQSLTGMATATVAGIVKISGATNSTATDTAASSAAVKAANDNAETRALKSTIISAGGLAVGGGDLSGSRTITVPVATQAQAEAAATTPATADNTTAMTALRVAQFFAALGLPSVANLIAAVADTTAVRSVATGGTGAATAAAARANLGLGTISTQPANAVSITGGAIAGITDLAIADGGTGASDAAGALANLGLPTAATIAAAVADTTAVRSIATGGTGASTAPAALTALGLAATAAQINGGIFYTSATAPAAPVEGMRWRDISTPANPIDRVYRLGAWVTELADLGITATAAQINAGVVPPGTVAHYANQTPPTGWLVRDGAAYSRSVYAALFAAIGTRYGAGDGTTTFNVPDDRGNFDRGWDNGRGIDAGRVFGSEQADDIRAHNHTIIGHVSQTAMAAAGGGGWGAGVGWPYTAASSTVIQNTGGTETRPRNRAYLPVIKF